MEPLIAGVRVVHATYVAFVCTAPALLWCGALLESRSLTARWLGRLHVACLGFVTLQLACGWPCPLTLLEERLAGGAGGSFVLPRAWADPAAIPPWVWPALASMWAVSLWAQRAAGRSRERSEGVWCSGSV